jgi:hypothetical protein
MTGDSHHKLFRVEWRRKSLLAVSVKVLRTHDFHHGERGSQEADQAVKINAAFRAVSQNAFHGKSAKHFRRMMTGRN